MSIAALVLFGCGADADTLSVHVASSLGPATEELAAAFEQLHDTDVEVVSAGSTTLVAGIIEGADADLLIPADEATMQRAIDAGVIKGPSTIVALNSLALAVPLDDPAGLLVDLDLAGARVAVCAPEVPCGRLTQGAISTLGLDFTPVTEETNVRSVLAKVELGEVDAGFVYASDVAAGTVAMVGLPGIEQFENRYPAAELEGAEPENTAKAFLTFLSSDTGAEIIERFGFRTP